MNAKKIMGAVLVALLAAALFVGAGAAAEGDQGTFFAYQANTGLSGIWMYGDNTVTITNGNVSAVPVAGTYTQGKNTTYFTNPTATYSAIGKYGETGSKVDYIIANGGNVYAGSNVTINVATFNASMMPNQLRVELPSGAVSFKDGVDFFNGNWVADEEGTYKVQAVWNETFAGFVEGAPLPVVDANVFTFTVVEADDATISASVDTVFAGDVIGVTIKGTPGEVYNLTLTGFASTQEINQIVKLQAITNGYNFTMPNIGEVTFQLKTAEGTDEVKIVFSHEGEDIDEIELNVAKPTLTATLGAASYFIGNVIELTVTSDITLDYKNYNFTITGTNFNETDLIEDTKDSKNINKGFTVYLPTANVNDTGKKLDVGTYTIKIYSGQKVVKTVSVALKQPFISIIEAPEVIVQGDEAEFVINAEAADNISAYFFGTNFYLAVHDVDSYNDVSNQFGVKLLTTDTANMSAGQYFAVFQHPMYDTFYNIFGTSDGKFYLNTSTNAYTTGNLGNGQFLFDVKDRQTANAAQALCDALETQNIDDMYVKASFFIVGEDESFTISEIPTSVAQGETLTISGVSTANAENTVTVEMISTAFAAVPKETVGSAAFIVVTTEVAEDGTWEVTLDTSDLNVDEYSLSVAVTKQDGKSETWKNVKINVVEGAETPDTPDTPDVPDTPDTPDTPTEPTTPGFGALAALAGLGAVAVLLLRRE